MRRQTVNDHLHLGETSGGSGRRLVLEVDTTAEFHVVGSIGGKEYEDTMTFGAEEGFVVELDPREALILRRSIDEWLETVGL
jgi:hypothetical protein